MEAKVKITVLFPVYNVEKYLHDAINSILNQTFKNFELLIINDGSTDNSKKIIQKFRDSRIKLISHSKNLGLVYSLNEGIKIARGKYIARMDADDISLPSRFEKQVNHLENHHCVVVSTKIKLIGTISSKLSGQGDNVLTSHEISKVLPDYNPIAHPSVMYRRSIIRQFGYRQNPLQLYTEDYDLWLRLIDSGYQICKINEALLNYRIHSSSASKKSRSSYKVVKAKAFFLLYQIIHLRFTKFTMKVFCAMVKDFVKESIHL